MTAGTIDSRGLDKREPLCRTGKLDPTGLAKKLIF